MNTIKKNKLLRNSYASHYLHVNQHQFHLALFFAVNPPKESKKIIYSYFEILAQFVL